MQHSEESSASQTIHQPIESLQEPVLIKVSTIRNSPVEASFGEEKDLLNSTSKKRKKNLMMAGGRQVDMSSLMKESNQSVRSTQSPNARNSMEINKNVILNK